MVDPLLSISVRAVALTAFILFAPVVASFKLAPGSRWPEYLGIFFHLATFFLVAKLPAPEWARAAGYSWLVLDVTTGAMIINRVPRAVADYVRLGGHIFAGIWIVVASLQGSAAAMLIGLPAGAFLFGYTFASPFLRPVWLSPASILVLLWLAIIAWQNGI
ncbi:hypothetical protein [Burkholderia sp. L27(2015)]|uniref:hypothetical protein n=1 Tax=Burkholderia sp. L27(2015) TaxID=1641858 RepID=UPI00131E6A41|nr:hypothetical protein [Burkholderia sp. L27(2015)]